MRQPVDDDKYIYVMLDFDSVEEAAAFKGFLETRVWTSAEASPALDGTPTARVLTDVRPSRRVGEATGADDLRCRAERHFCFHVRLSRKPVGERGRAATGRFR